MIETDALPGRIRNRPLKDYTGQSFARLTALELVERRADNDHIWRFRCECGATKDLRIKSVRGGHTKSCGCLLRTMLASRNTTHGMSGKLAATYRSWKEMRARCLNENDADYPSYGGRGILICAAWADCSAFVSDMGARPTGKTLDRIQVNGNYGPDNCRWADAATQANNKRSNHFIRMNGETKTLAQWCQQFSIEPAKVRYRIKAGWPMDRVFQQEGGRR